MGFDEITVLKELLLIFKQKPNLFLIITLHPLQNTEQIVSILSEFNIDNVLIDTKKINNYYYYVTEKELEIGLKLKAFIVSDKIKSDNGNKQSRQE